MPLDQILIARGVKPEDVLAARGESLNIPVRLIGPDAIIPFEVLDYIPQESAIQYKVAPLSVKDGTLEVGIVDPDNIDARDALNFIAAKRNIPYKIFLPAGQRKWKKYDNKPRSRQESPSTRASKAAATGRSPNNAARSESAVTSTSCASCSNSANSRIMARRIGTSDSVAELMVNGVISFSAFAIGVAARHGEQDVRRLDDGDDGRAFFQLERFGGGLGDDRDDFSAARQGDGDFGVHHAADDLADFANDFVAGADVHDFYWINSKFSSAHSRSLWSSSASLIFSISRNAPM